MSSVALLPPYSLISEVDNNAKGVSVYLVRIQHD